MRMATTEVKQVFRMKEGTDETSYAKASYIPSQVLSLTKPIKEKATRNFYRKEQPTTTICIADLGCSSAEQNTLTLISEFINTVNKTHKELGNNGVGPQEYQVYLNDLPGNDFNTLFKSLGDFETMLKENNKDGFGHCFVNGAPGSFYGRLFPSNHLHFVHSSYSLHWLSQVPKGIEDNKENVCIGRTSPANVLKAYYDQRERDFSTFLKCRSEEVVGGGVMVLTLLGRRSNELYSKESYSMFDFVSTALNDMVSEGLIEEEKLTTFNFPFYPISKKELEYWVEKEGSFTVNQVEISEVNWKTTKNNNSNYNSIPFAQNDFAICMRSVMEPFLINHFGEAIIEDFFRRYTEIANCYMANEKKNIFINVTIWVTRK